MNNKKNTEKTEAIDTCGVKIVLSGCKEFLELVKVIAAQGEDVSKHPYIILSKEMITLEKRQEVREWYKGFTGDLLEKGKSGKRSVKQKARKRLKDIGWIIDWEKAQHNEH